MIYFNYLLDFKLKNEVVLSNWISSCIDKYNYKTGELNYIFCDDAYLHNLNVEFLNHDTLTDIISFDNTVGKIISGDMYISIERVKDNAQIFNVSFDDELYRVMIHGVLHYLGFKDKSASEISEMRSNEDQCLLMLKS